ncbi:MAG: type III secretion system inner membrane ring lipoprotein SctJ [Methyloligellaceae bacterium]
MSKNPLYLLPTIMIVLLLFGCKENLYSELSEKEVNMMVAILDENGIQAERQKDEQNKFTLKIEKEAFTKAVKILSAKGYPRQKFQSMADVFSNEGIVKTPFEQRARFVHALNQELSRSISEIDGVISARVHITLPEKSRFGKTTEKARAAVIIVHRRSKSLHEMKPKIKQIVAHSVNGVTYENVTVVMSSADEIYKKGNSPTSPIDLPTYAQKTSAKTNQSPNTRAASFLTSSFFSWNLIAFILLGVGLIISGRTFYLWYREKQ